MPRRLRFIPPDSLVEVTCRTLQGRLLLRPSPTLRELTLGVLARAARLYPVELHGFVFLSNHFHLLVTVPDAQRLASFMNYLNSNLAREVGRLICWREKFWGRRYQAILVSSEEKAQITRLRYILAHGVKEGLVASPLDWPGAHCAQALLDGAPVFGRWVDRTRESAASRRRRIFDAEASVKIEELHLAPLPCWKELSATKIRDRVRELVADLEGWAERERRAGRLPFGRDYVLRQDPRQEPNRTKKSVAPLAHAASRTARAAIRQAYRLFHASFRQAAEKLRAGGLSDLFPEGSFPPPSPFRPAAAPG